MTTIKIPIRAELVNWLAVMKHSPFTRRMRNRYHPWNQPYEHYSFNIRFVRFTYVTKVWLFNISYKVYEQFCGTVCIFTSNVSCSRDNYNGLHIMHIQHCIQTEDTTILIYKFRKTRYK